MALDKNKKNSYDTNDYMAVNEKLASTNDTVGGKTAGGAGNTPTTDDYYQLARDQEYGTLFDKEIQLENAKANAQKYTKNQINAQGFGGTGYGSSLESGIYNEYVNKVSGAQEAYNENIRNINLEEQQAEQDKANDRFASVTTMLTQATTQEQMDNLLVDYGYGYLKDDGTFEWNEEKPEGMSDDDWYQTKYYYNLQKDAIGEINNNDIPTVSGSIDDIKKRAFNEDGTIKDQAQYARYSYLQLQESGYYVQGLGNGRDTDDIDITIGSNSRNKDSEFDLLAGVSPSEAVKTDLNSICNGQQQNGQLVVYQGKLYIYTEKGWKNVQSDHSNVEDCIKAIYNLIGGGN